MWTFKGTFRVPKRFETSATLEWGRHAKFHGPVNHLVFSGAVNVNYIKSLILPDFVIKIQKIKMNRILCRF